MNHVGISVRVSEIVQNLLDPEKAHAPIDDQFVLGTDREFDSVWALKLVVALENEFSIAIEDTDVKTENFRDIPALTEFVAAKLSRPSDE